MNEKVKTVGFLWPELPYYGAKCLGALRQHNPQLHVHVMATKPRVPMEGLESAFGEAINWLDHSANVNWSDFTTSIPAVIFVAGYSCRATKALEDEGRKAGAKIVLMSDNSWIASLKQKILEPARHRLLYRWKYDAVFVPGSTGYTMAQKWGYADKQIYTGVYGADGQIYQNGEIISKREKRIVFAGQLIKRKNVDLLCEAFVSVSHKMPDWSLSLCGTGDLLNKLPRHPKITFHGFTQPRELSLLLKKSRCLALLSSSENWGLVVHEATLSGCALFLSDMVGAHHDLCSINNAIVCNIKSPSSVSHALLELSRWPDDKWRVAQKSSLKFSQAFGPKHFSKSVCNILHDLGQL